MATATRSKIDADRVDLFDRRVDGKARPADAGRDRGEEGDDTDPDQEGDAVPGLHRRGGEDRGDGRVRRGRGLGHAVTLVVAPTGVDPVTSRFSVVRSTN